MILNGLILGVIASILIWIVTSVRIFFRGRLLLPILAAGVHSLCGAAVVLVSMYAPTFSSLWTGVAGGGDGQALMGLAMAGCFVVMEGIVLALVAWILSALSERLAKRPKEEPR